MRPTERIGGDSRWQRRSFRSTGSYPTSAICSCHGVWGCRRSRCSGCEINSGMIRNRAQIASMTRRFFWMDNLRFGARHLLSVSDKVLFHKWKLRRTFDVAAGTGRVPNLGQPYVLLALLFRLLKSVGC
ncbi:hypothetical protein BD410DRAFT_191921 [Rickenella mellea]|uniref:Uncharacterized protein n=1 Tax=Rickenella mellea TaxID=50990 RepID=A0A4Y7PGG0_9AGAM|nr:hypothetical protein BD410DRAFT_191921 [Rickenella mellea]